MSGWKVLDLDDISTRPTVEGRYAIVVDGDEERDGAHVFYSFNDYQTLADGRLYEFDPGGDAETVEAIRFYGDHDEGDETVIAWYGPLADGEDAPPYGNDVTVKHTQREEA